jgi:hypothetical protein
MLSGLFLPAKYLSVPPYAWVWNVFGIMTGEGGDDITIKQLACCK